MSPSPIKRQPFKLLGLFLLAGTVALVLQTLIKAGAFKSIKDYEDGLTVESLAAPPGIEDLDYDPASGTVFLSSHDRRKPGSDGAIYALNPVIRKIRNLTGHLALPEFRPHGISFLDFNGSRYLFVISHRNTKNVVVKFRFENDSLHLENTYSGTDFSSPNDLLAVGENAFFLTNDHGTAKGWRKVVADYLRLPVGNVVYYDGIRSGVVLDKIAYPNGLALYRDKIYIASTLGNTIGIYTPVSANYQLEKEKTLKVPDAPDNLMVYRDRIYYASHPKLLAFTAHAADSTKISPSSVYYLENDVPRLVFMDSGARLSGSSTALPVPDSSGNVQLYIGSVYESRLLKLNKVRN
ncbi:MAG: hypothetical protein LRY55_14580 [Leadbetterella sp.]|nr:hypothetical protein [Leadbetterella sp.]